jgi:hypothetical protein
MVENNNTNELESLLVELSQLESDETAARVAFEVLKNHPKIWDITLENDPSRLVVTTFPVIITNPNGTETSDLGRLKIFVERNGSYGVTRDRDSPRDPSITTDQVHPHVSNGSICQGNATDMTKIAHERNLPMLVSFIIEFLQFYNPRSPYWHIYFKHPCKECGLGETSQIACRFCKCKGCGNKRSNDSCEGCAEWKQQSAISAKYFVKDLLDSVCDRDDEDDFIAKATSVITILEKRE